MDASAPPFFQPAKEIQFGVVESLASRRARSF